MYKSKFYCLTAIAVLMNLSVAAKETDGGKIQYPCRNFNPGSKRTYLQHNGEGRSNTIIEETVVSNENNRIKTLTKTYSQPKEEFGESQIISNYIVENGSTFTISRIIDNQNQKSTLKYLKPEPFCGLRSSQWSDSSQMTSDMNGQVYRQNLPSSTTFYKYIGKEFVAVKAGRFEAFVFEERKKVDHNDGIGSFTTNIMTIYMVKDIGWVKYVNVSIGKTRKIKNKSGKNDPEMEKKIMEGLRDLQEGKDISEIAFFNDTVKSKNEIPVSDEFETTKTVMSGELISFSN